MTQSRDHLQQRPSEPETDLHASQEQKSGEKGPLVSVVIPCYNQAHFLGEAIESVLSQSYPHHEIVVVDDGSTDDTSEVASRYDGVRLVRQENQGANAARNTGIRHSEGDYLVFLDADDRLLPEALEVGVRELEAHPECAFVFGHSDIIAEDGIHLRTPLPPLIGDDLLTILLSRSFYVVPGEVMHRRSTLENAGLFDESLNASEDYELYFRIMRKSSVYCHGKTVLEHREHDANTTRNAGKMLKGTIKVLRSQRGYVKGDKLLREAYKAGIKKGRKEYGRALARDLRAWMREGEWNRALDGVWTLLRYYPGGLLLLSKRFWMAREIRYLNDRLEHRTERLKERNERIRELNQALKKDRLELREQRTEVRRLRQQSRQSELRAQELQRQLQEIQDSESWKLLLKLAHLRAKVGGR